MRLVGLLCGISVAWLTLSGVPFAWATLIGVGAFVLTVVLVTWIES